MYEDAFVNWEPYEVVEDDGEEQHLDRLCLEHYSGYIDEGGNSPGFVAVCRYDSAVGSSWRVVVDLSEYGPTRMDGLRNMSRDVVGGIRYTRAYHFGSLNWEEFKPVAEQRYKDLLEMYERW